MNYGTKVVIGQQELMEEQDVALIDGEKATTPSITDVQLSDAACTKTMEIGATASNCLVFRILNPNRNSFDGETVQLYLTEIETAQRLRAEEIEEEVGTSATSEVTYDDTGDTVEPDEEEGEDLTPEDEQEVEIVDAALEAGLDMMLSGEELSEPEEDTDPDADPEDWDLAGTFYVYTQSNNEDGSITLTCFDGFINMNGFFYPASATATIGNMYEDFRAKVLSNCGIAVDEEDFGDITDTLITMDFVVSYREAMGLFAGLRGGFAEFGPDGSCGISQYCFDNNVLIDTELISYAENSAGEMTVEAVSCNRARDALSDTDIIEAGEGGQNLHFNNPLMTEDILQEIYDSYKGMRFCGAKATVRWNRNLAAGEFVRIFSEAEYRNFLMLSNQLQQNSGSMSEEEIKTIRSGMNSLGRIILISSQLISFKGTATATINSICESESEKENKPVSPTDAKFRRVYADLVETKELVAGKATIIDLEAQNAMFTNAVINTGVANEFAAAKISFNEAAGQTFTAQQITALDAAFDQAVVGTLSAGNISAVLGTFSDLLTGSFTADQISAAKAYLQTALIQTLQVAYLRTKYADIDFANVTTEAVKNLFVNVGILENAVIHEGQITGTLAGVTVVADVIEADAIVAGDLIVQDEDQEGVYYKINPTASGLTVDELSALDYEKFVSGKYIVAKSITADQIAVSDLVAFGATIAGLQMENGSIHSLGKTSVDSNAPGMYFDSAGQFNTGDANNFIASWYDTEEEKWKVAIRADQISFGSGQDVEAVVTNAVEAVQNMEDRMDSGEFRGEDGTVLRIDSSRGTVFKNNQVSTVLNVTIYSGSDTIDNIADLRAKFGSGAHLQWYWQKIDESDYGTIVASDHKLSRDGFSLMLTPDEVDVKVTFRCELIIE